MTTTARKRMTALTANTPTNTLITSLRALEDAATPEERHARSVIIETLEARHPAASQAVEDAFLADELLLMAGVDAPGVDYAQVLIDAITDGGTR